MWNVLVWSEIVIAVIMIFVTLFQESKSTPLATYGGNREALKPKGKEAVLNNLTKVFGVLLFINAILLLKIQQMG
jgi:protein translocase SecG subunit